MRHLLAAGSVLAITLAGAANASASRSESYLACGSQDAYSVSVRPKECLLDWPNLPLAQAVGLRHVAWSSWGAATAHGRAVMRTKTYDPWTHVRVRATGRHSCGGKAFVYTRVRVDFGHGTIHTWRTPGCSVLSGADY